MKLRRALAATAVSAAIAPMALLAAPAAYATETPGSASPTVTESATETATVSPTASESQSATATATSEPSASDTQSATTDPTATESATETASASPTASTSPSASDDATAPSDDESWNPYEDCKSFDLDEKLTASISGLPNQIVAGSGWHEFEFVVTNDSDKDLQKVWVEAFTEYSDDTNEDASLAFDLAEIQYKLDGKWTSSYQDYFEDEDGEFHFTGTFVALLDSLEKHSTATMDLRVRVNKDAPAGSSFALSQAVYAGEKEACYGNGDFYDFTVLAAGSKPSDNVDDAKPSGEKPDLNDGTKPQGSVKEITGNLAETGSSSALPMIGLVGGVAVVAGAGAVFVVRRKKAGAQA
ncbi:LPXTG cell wall anchor domain-containing protein [Streptomyces sp. TRM72054]|uniref:LAETG motif-containing sortase-dependent surface protein n=1 Tax=Streptomyces sp. TRM72054 TaxID=2870562 RepID=UPI001C8B208D|nr:LAETG motif-containing sortase-dependent surface protein [Streptomyces sp. TRM72054]MBX9397001.1 LPXTG cell wall anchor domain-containing protein [Streptomyces sp. TRM72054]